MHITLLQRAALPGGGVGNRGQVFDLPDAEAKALLKAKVAVEGTNLPEPQPEPAQPTQPAA